MLARHCLERTFSISIDSLPVVPKLLLQLTLPRLRDGGGRLLKRRGELAHIAEKAPSQDMDIDIPQVLVAFQQVGGRVRLPVLYVAVVDDGNAEMLGHLPLFQAE